MSVLLLLMIAFNSVIVSKANAQGEQEAAVLDVKLERAKEYVEEQFQRNDLIGGAVGIVYKDKMVSFQGLGTAAKGNEDAAPTSNTVYSFASVTKAFTATAIIQLYDQGLLDIDKPVRTYIPWFSFKNEEAFTPVTVRDLLNHSAGGISSYQTNAVLFKDKDAKKSLETYVRLTTDIEMKEQPGATGSYCNGCYDTLGLIIENVTGMSYYDYMQTHIFEPLEMDNTMYGHSLDEKGDLQIATEVDWFFASKSSIMRSFETFGQSQDPDGGMYSTIEDMSKYLAYQLGYFKKDLISMETVESSRIPQVQTEMKTAYYSPAGFEVANIQNTKIFFKTGDGTGSASAILFIPDYDIGVALIIGEFHPEIQEQMVKDIGAILMGIEPEPWDVPFTLGKLVGYAAIVLVVVSLVLLVIFLSSRVRYRNRPAQSIHLGRSVFGLVFSIIIAVPLWYLLLAVRLSPVSFLGYPYDLAIGLVMNTVVLTLGVIIYTRAIVLRRSASKKDSLEIT
ncbi:D-alanyl-D-alanine-carboxypeptidase/endopeptidase AmpH precursor [compost metagenome]